MQNFEAMLTVRDVAQRLGVSERRVMQLDRVLAPVRLGRARGYDPEAIAAYAAHVDAQRAARTAKH